MNSPTAQRAPIRAQPTHFWLQLNSEKRELPEVICSHSPWAVAGVEAVYPRCWMSPSPAFTLVWSVRTCLAPHRDVGDEVHSCFFYHWMWDVGYITSLRLTLALMTFSCLSPLAGIHLTWLYTFNSWASTLSYSTRLHLKGNERRGHLQRDLMDEDTVNHFLEALLFCTDCRESRGE